MIDLAEARKLTWLKEGSSAIQQQALRDLDRAFSELVETTGSLWQTNMA